MSEFYIKGSDELYFGPFWEGERRVLSEESATLMTREEANGLHVESMFIKELNDDKPNLKRSYNFFAIPYELDDDILFNGRRLIEVIIDLVNSQLKSEIYCASTDRDKCCVVKSRRFSERMIWSISSGHLNTPFIVFDKRKDFFLLFDYDLPVQLVGYKSGVLSEEDVGMWKEFFFREWPNVQKRYAKYSNLSSLMKKYYNFIAVPS
jgi:hypothetical protein